MNTQLIPTINAETFEEVKEKIKILEEAAFVLGFEWIQIDVADGTFTDNILWNNPADLNSMGTNLKIEVHLMLDDIDSKIEDWIFSKVDRIIFHIETAKDPDLVINKCKVAGKEVGIALRFDTAVEHALEFKDSVDIYQVLGVVPGTAGQKTQEEAFNKIKVLRNACESCIIEIDGGTNEETAKKAVDAGANLIIAASAVFKDGQVKENIKRLKKIIK